MTVCECALYHDRDDDVDECRVQSEDGYYCTRPAGHDGRHAACSPSEHPCTTWEQTDD